MSLNEEKEKWQGDFVGFVVAALPGDLSHWGIIWRGILILGGGFL